MKKYWLLSLVLVLSVPAFGVGRFQNEDHKSLTELVVDGGSMAQLLNDTKVFLTGKNKQLSTAISDGTLGYGPTTSLSSNATMAANNRYIANFTGTKGQLMLPPVCTEGESLQIMGKGSAGWSVWSNPAATAQNIVQGNASSFVSGSSAINLYENVGQYDCAFLTCTTADATWSILNAVGGFLHGNYYGDASDGDFSGAGVTLVVPNKNGSYDGDMVVKNYNNFDLTSGTLTTDQPGRGLLIYVRGNAIVRPGAVISMTARGAAADPTASGASDAHAVPAGGLVIRRIVTGQTSSNSDTDLFWGTGLAAVAAEANQPALTSNGRVFVIARAGAAGGAGVQTGNGGSGSSGAGLSGGGGGGGANVGGGYHSGSGAAGTCFSGGSGGGGSRTLGSEGNGGDGGANGGAGGNGNSSGNAAGCGGAGNAGGTASQYGYGGQDGQSGTGGLLVMIVRGNLTIAGTIESRGMRGGNLSATADATAGGGSAGGGPIVYLYGRTLDTTGATITAAGGAGGCGDGCSSHAGGSGGDGSIQAAKIDP